MCFENFKLKNAWNCNQSRREQWRIIIEPLDENEQTYNPCNIDEIAENVRVVEIMEVSKHYE